MTNITVEVGVRRDTRGPMERVTAAVDSGLTYSMFPASLLSRLGVEVWEYGRRFDINGAEAYYDFGTAHLLVDGRELPCPVAFGPEGLYLLGATTLQAFGLIVEQASQRLVRR